MEDMINFSDWARS